MPITANRPDAIAAARTAIDDAKPGAVLRHVADLLDAFPGIPAPTVIVYASGTASVGFHGADARARVAAVDMLLAAVGGIARQAPWGSYEGSVGSWHGHRLDVIAYDVTTVGVV